jgi:Putative peptidoglycan binding domain
MSRTTKVVTAIVVLGLAGAAGLVATQWWRRHNAPPAPVSIGTSTAVVARKTVTERQYVSGTLGYSASYVVPGVGSGTLTWLPAVGTVVKRGDALYELDGKRVTLLYGNRPAWRGFALGMSDGVDVLQLETNLQQLGFGSGVTVDRKFTRATYNAIRRWQEATPHTTVTGTLPLGSIGFMPGAIRISGQELELGAQVQPGAAVADSTSTVPAVNLAASTDQLGWIKVKTPVVVSLPDGSTRNGTVRTIGATTTSTSTVGGQTQTQTTVAVTVSIEGEATGFVDQASVQVWVIRATHANVLTVPINALNSVSDGKYEVIVVDGASTHRVPVQTGLFDDLTGTAEVSGSGLAEGQKVQVPHEDS